MSDNPDRHVTTRPQEKAVIPGCSIVLRYFSCSEADSLPLGLVEPFFVEELELDNGCAQHIVGTYLPTPICIRVGANTASGLDDAVDIGFRNCANRECLHA